MEKVFTAQKMRGMGENRYYRNLRVMIKTVDTVVILYIPPPFEFFLALKVRRGINRAASVFQYLNLNL